MKVVSMRCFAWSVAVLAVIVIYGVAFIGDTGTETIDGSAESSEEGTHLDSNVVRAFLPVGSTIIMDAPMSHGWRQTWKIAIGLKDVESRMSAALSNLGYVRMRTVGDISCGVLLSEWQMKDRHRVMLSLWRENERTTGFSWGEVVK